MRNDHALRCPYCLKKQELPKWCSKCAHDLDVSPWCNRCEAVVVPEMCFGCGQTFEVDELQPYIERVKKVFLAAHKWWLAIHRKEQREHPKPVKTVVVKKSRKHEKDPVLQAEPVCQCGDRDGIVFDRKFGWRCQTCMLELTQGVLPDMREITSGKRGHVPLGMSIVRLGRQPGTGDGNDYFGNHT